MNNDHPRSHLLGLLAAVAVVLFGAAGCGADDNSSSADAGVNTHGLKLDQPFKFKQTAQTDFVPEYIAQEKGFFKAYNLDVKMVPVTVGGAALMPLLEAGQIDVTTGIGVSATMIGRAQGSDVVGVASGYRTSPEFTSWEYLVRADSGISGPEDMENRKVGIQSPGATPDIAFDAWVKNAGSDPATNTKVPIPYANMPTALLSGQVDVIQIISPALGPWQAQNKAEAKKLVTVGTAADAVPADRLFTAYAMRGDFVKKHPEVVKAWTAAMTDAVAWIKANPKEAAAIVEKAGAIADASLAVLPNWSDDLCLDGSASQDWIDLLVGSDQIKKGSVDSNDWYTNEYNPNGCP